MLRTSVSGANPTWNQPLSTNDEIELAGAHTLQVFAFADGPQRSVNLLNLSRTEALPVRFAGADAPSGMVTETRLTAAHITDSNEDAELVKPVSTVHKHVRANAGEDLWLPAFPLTTLTWRSR